MRLPGILAQIAEAAGEDAAWQVARVFGGQRLSIAQNPGPTSPLARAVGVECAALIAREIGWGDVIIPLGPRARPQVIRRLLRDGISHNEIARRVGCHIRTVEHHSSRLRREGDAAETQLSLPLDDDD